jgi:tRNA-binding protein
MQITWQDFEQVELRVGTIIRVEDFPKAKKTAYQVWIDFGDEVGIKKSSAQITHHYSKESLLQKQVICVTNFPPRQVADFMSEVLITGFVQADNTVILAVPDQPVPNGSKLA